MTTDDDVWFEQKRFGYGAGLPIRWQGWVLMLGFAAMTIAVGVVLTPRHPALFAGLVALAVVPLLLIAARHTRGGWRWRWGESA